MGCSRIIKIYVSESGISYINTTYGIVRDFKTIGRPPANVKVSYDFFCNKYQPDEDI